MAPSVQVVQEWDQRCCQASDLYQRQAFQEYLTLAEQNLQFARVTADRHKEAIALNQIGLAHTHLGHLKLAFKFYHHALLLCRDLGEQAGELTLLLNMGAICTDLQRFDQAHSLYLEASRLSETWGISTCRDRV